MRIIHNGSMGLIKPHRSDSEQPSEHPPKEIEATCTSCLSVFAFTLLDEGVSLDNERDYNVECPVCTIDLRVGAVTGIVFQR